MDKILLRKTRKILRAPEDGQPAFVLECKQCSGRDFNVASGDYLTVVQCIKCRIHVTVHEG